MCELLRHILLLLNAVTTHFHVLKETAISFTETQIVAANNCLKGHWDKAPEIKAPQSLFDLKC